MTTHKSDTYNSGIMPDYTMPGVVLARTCKFVAENDDVESADTLYLMQLPEGAMILDIHLQIPAIAAGTTGCDLGIPDDPDYFFAAFNLVTAGNMCLSGGAVGTIASGAVASRLGVTLTNDEILQLAIPKAPTKLPTNSAITVTVFYKMTGVIEDEE